MSKTVAMAGNKTQAMGMEDRNRLPLRSDVFVEGRKDTYEISASNRIGVGGEAQVYLAKRVSDGEQVVAKIYDIYKDDHASRIDRENVLSFLNENSDYERTHIMPLIDSGEVTFESIDGEHSYTRSLDIIPYCKDGELSRCSYQELRIKVIPQVTHALNLLHSKNLVHRDIKPSNIYMYNGEIVLADFGTTSEIMNSEVASKTESRRGTPGYTAPEISEEYYLVASDYYSLGCTIATLYKGEHVYQGLIDSRKMVEVNIAMRREGLPLDCPEEEGDLQLLVNALVMPDSGMRADYNDVALWLENPKFFVSKWRNKTKSGFESTTLDFKFEGVLCKTAEELTDEILKNWEMGKEKLYNSQFKNYFDQRDQDLAQKAFNIVEKEVPGNPDLGLAMFLHFLNTTTDQPKCPIYWQGQAYGSLPDISNAISAKEADEKSITTMLKDRFLSWKLSNTMKNTDDNAIDLINAVEEIEEITKKHPQLGYYLFKYRFASEATKNINSSDKIFKGLAGTDIKKWYQSVRDMLKDDDVLACLLSLGYKENILALKSELTGTFISDDKISDLGIIYRLFEGICEDKTYVRDHYLHYGPRSYLYWFKQNLNLYSFNSSRAKDIEQQIKNVKISDQMSIIDIDKSVESLKQNLIDFLSLLQNNYLLTHLGLSTSKNAEGITTENTHAFFVGDFLGTSVPVGYLKSINLKSGEQI